MLLSSNKSGRGFEVGQGSEAGGWEFRFGGGPEVGESRAAGMAGMPAKQKARQ